MSTTADVLTRTFVHIPGIGIPTERALWAGGILSWQQFLRARSVGVPIRSRPRACELLEESTVALKAGDIRFFAEHLPRSEWWRLYLPFRERAVFLDIETTGLSHHYDDLTIVGLYDGMRFKTLVAGHNLDDLEDHLRRYDILVTFNGSLFDVPFLRNKLPSLRLPSIHLDLRYILRKLGYGGPLKDIEQRLGIQRENAARIDGLMATVLWARYLQGNVMALEQLLRYNAADIMSLQSLMDFGYRRLALQLLEEKGRHSTRVVPVVPRTPKRILIHVHRTTQLTRVLVDGVRMMLRNQQRRGPEISISEILSTLPKGQGTPRIVGLDLTGSEKRPSGVAFLCGSSAQATLLGSDADIESATLEFRPDIVSIDSPLGLPTGRCCTRDECECRRHGIVRECERILWKRGVRVYPSLLPSMQGLTARGIRLAARLRARGVAVIESYPGAAQDIMRIPRKRTSLADLAAGLNALGICFEPPRTEISHDELDAVTSAVVGLFFWAGRFEALGREEEALLIVPSLAADCQGWLRRRVVGLSGPIAAGKTTASKALEERGFLYARFSLVLADLLRERRIQPTREALQAVGWEVNQTLGQRWLGHRLVASLPKDGNIVIDGLRYPEDHSFLVERFGPAFRHIHVSADPATRQARHAAECREGTSFDEISRHPVEEHVHSMSALAHRGIENSADLATFIGSVVDAGLS